MNLRVGMRTYIAVVSLAGVGVTLAVQAVSPALPELQRVLGLNNSQIGWIVTAYVLPGVLLTLPMGVVSDVIGRRRLFTSALIIYGVAAVVQGMVLSYPLLLTMRVIQGACFAAAMPLTITLIGEAFSGSQRVKALAGRNAILSGSEVVLPVGGALLAALSWRAPLLVQAVTIPLAIYSLGVIEERQVTRSTDSTYARDLFRVLRDQHGIIAVLLTAFGRFFFKLSLLSYLPVLLVTEGSATVTQVGVVISSGALVAMITAAGVPTILNKIRPSSAAVTGMVILGISVGTFALVDDWRWGLVVATAYGIGDGVIAVLQDTYALHTSQSHVRGGMVSVSQSARNLGKFVGPLTMTAIVAVSSVEVAFMVMACVGVVLAPMMLPLRGMDQELQGADPTATGEAAQRITVGERAPYE